MNAFLEELAKTERNCSAAKMQWEIASVAALPRNDTMNIAWCHCEARSAEAIPFDKMSATEQKEIDNLVNSMLGGV